MTTSKARVLLADDDAGLRRLMVTTLGRDRFDLLEAVDGPEALRVAQEQAPDLLLLDVNMPGLDGYEVCRRLKATPQTASIKVVILTGRGSDADRAQAQDVGADAYFSKPFSPVQLLDRVYALLG